MLTMITAIVTAVTVAVLTSNNTSSYSCDSKNPISICKHPITDHSHSHGNKILTLRLKMAQKPYIIWSLGPKALKSESLEP